jgi:hypothetical protein
MFDLWSKSKEPEKSKKTLSTARLLGPCLPIRAKINQDTFVALPNTTMNTELMLVVAAAGLASRRSSFPSKA